MVFTSVGKGVFSLVGFGGGSEWRLDVGFFRWRVLGFFVFVFVSF